LEALVQVHHPRQTEADMFGVADDAVWRPPPDLVSGLRFAYVLHGIEQPSHLISG